MFVMKYLKMILACSSKSWIIFKDDINNLDLDLKVAESVTCAVSIITQ